MPTVLYWIRSWIIIYYLWIRWIYPPWYRIYKLFYRSMANLNGTGSRCGRSGGRPWRRDISDGRRRTHCARWRARRSLLSTRPMFLCADYGPWRAHFECTRDFRLSSAVVPSAIVRRSVLAKIPVVLPEPGQSFSPLRLHFRTSPSLPQITRTAAANFCRASNGRRGRAMPTFKGERAQTARGQKKERHWVYGFLWPEVDDIRPPVDWVRPIGFRFKPPNSETSKTVAKYVFSEFGPDLNFGSCGEGP